jgi:hypothetical protein
LYEFLICFMSAKCNVHFIHRNNVWWWIQIIDDDNGDDDEIDV